VLGFLPSRRNWDPPLPHPQASVPPPLWFRRRDTLACGRGGGGLPIRTRGQILWYFRYLCTLCWRRLLTGDAATGDQTDQTGPNLSENANIAYLGSTVPSAQAHLLKSSLPLLGQGFTSIQAQQIIRPRNSKWRPGVTR
jgi:hypothetical protein